MANTVHVLYSRQSFVHIFPQYQKAEYQYYNKTITCSKMYKMQDLFAQPHFQTHEHKLW